MIITMNVTELVHVEGEDYCDFCVLVSLPLYLFHCGKVTVDPLCYYYYLWSRVSWDFLEHPFQRFIVVHASGKSQPAPFML